MPEHSSRSSRTRRARDSLRDQRVPSSARSSRHVDHERAPSPHEPRHQQYQQQQQQQYHQQQNLSVPPRSQNQADDRISLHEGFATTASVFEFGFDDGSSFISAARTRYDPDEDDENEDEDDDAPARHAAPGLLRPPPGYVSRDYFELLCLPRQTPSSPAQVRAAYSRLFRLLDAELQPADCRNLVAAYLAAVQAAVETLVEPARRAEYLEELALRASQASLSGIDDYVSHLPESSAEAQQLLRSRRRRRLMDALESSNDVAIRLDAMPVTSSLPGSPSSAVEPLDFCIGHSTAVPLTALGHLLVGALQRLKWLESEDCSAQDSRLLLSTPKLTVSGYSYGLLRDFSRVPAPLLADRYQPLLPEPLPRHRMAQLFISRIAPLVTVGLKNEIVRLPKHHGVHLRDSDWSPYDPLTTPDPEPSRVLVLENELDLLPGPALITRVAHSIDLDDGNGAEPLDLEVMITAPITPSMWRRPRAGLALQRRVGLGTGFVCADSGELSFLNSFLSDDAATCGGLRQDRMWGRSLSGALLSSSALRAWVAPTLEVGYTSLAPGELGLLGVTGRPLTGPADRGLKGLDAEAADASSGSWTVSVAATPGYVAGYLRYGLELVSAIPRAVTSLLPFDPKAYHIELELCTPPATTALPMNMGSLYGGYIAIRALRRAGNRSSLGFEVGLSPSSFHLSLYWSRLAQRFRLPMLLRTNPSTGRGSIPHAVSFVTPPLAFWSVLLPMVGLAALDLARLRNKAGRSVAAAAQDAEKKRAMLSMTKDDLADHVACRRAEADELTSVLAVGAQARQQVERDRNGLVILAAKYGVPDLPSDDAFVAAIAAGAIKSPSTFSSDYEVADVVVAVAALVQSGHGDDAPGSLLIPAGLRKSRLLGFWDPAPLRTKVLQVRYLYRGKEGLIEVRGREELRLPPAA